MTPRNPGKEQFATLEALGKLEAIVGENSETIKDILTLLGGNPFKNGRGIVDRLHTLEGIVSTLKEDIRIEIKDSIREELQNFSPNGNQVKADSFKDFPTWKKLTAIVVITSALGIGGTGILEILNKIIEFLIKFVGGG